MVASRRASIVLPVPGGPTKSRWCPPAAATSKASPGEREPAHVARGRRGSSSESGDRVGVRSGAGVPVGPRLLALQARAQLAERARRAHLHVADERGLGGVRERHDDALDAARGQRVDERERAGHRADRAVEPELAEHRDAVEHAGGQLVVGAEQRRARRRARARSPTCARRRARG